MFAFLQKLNGNHINIDNKVCCVDMYLFVLFVLARVLSCVCARMCVGMHAQHRHTYILSALPFQLTFFCGVCTRFVEARLFHHADVSLVYDVFLALCARWLVFGSRRLGIQLLGQFPVFNVRFADSGCVLFSVFLGRQTLTRAGHQRPPQCDQGP